MLIVNSGSRELREKCGSEINDIENILQGYTRKYV